MQIYMFYSVASLFVFLGHLTFDYDQVKMIMISHASVDIVLCVVLYIRTKPRRGFQFNRDYIVKLKHLIQSQDFFDIASFKIS